MPLNKSSGGGVILTTFLFGLVLTVLPLPEWALSFRPQWYALILAYWVMALPQRVGVGTAWGLGICVDVVSGTILGQHALGLSLIAFVVHHFHQQLRLYPLWHQAMAMLALLTLERLLSLWVIGVTHQVVTAGGFWIGPVMGMLLWPWIFVVLRDVRRRFRVS